MGSSHDNDPLTWPDNPIADLLRAQDRLLDAVTVASVTTPRTPLGVAVRWCREGCGVAPDATLRLDGGWTDRAQLHLWCAELAWAGGSPELVRTDTRPDAIDRTKLFGRKVALLTPELFAASPGPDWVRTQLLAEARATGLTTWSWDMPAHWGRHSPETAVRLLDLLRHDTTLRPDGSRTLQFPWLDWVSCPIREVTPIPADDGGHTRAYDLRTPPLPARGDQEPQAPFRRRGRSIPEEVLERIVGLNPDVAALVARIRTDSHYAANGEELLADLVLNVYDESPHTSPLTADEMNGLTACLEGRAYGSPREG